jgi:ubiquinone/menaquinone biosynthesis C-methylase UbiE/predicted ester cyclase
MSQQNIEIARRTFQMLERNDLSSMSDVLAPDYLNHESIDDGRSVLRGPAEFKQTAQWLRRAFGNIHFEEEEAFADSDKVFIRTCMRGTHVGQFFGNPPSGKAIAHHQFHVFRIEGGKIAEHRAMRDDIGLMKQLAAKPSGPPAASENWPTPRKDRGIEGSLAKWYAKNTGKMLGEFQALAQRVSKEISPHARVLEVAPGPGYFCIELARLGPHYSITGLDISYSFVAMGKENAARAGVKVDFRQGNASNLPFANDTFDFLLCRAAFKNFAEPSRALKEMCRVLKPGGRGVIIDLKREASQKVIGNYVDTMGQGAVDRFLTKLIFRKLVKTAYTRTQFEILSSQAGFSKVTIKEEEIGYEIWMTK